MSSACVIAGAHGTGPARVFAILTVSPFHTFALCVLEARRHFLGLPWFAANQPPPAMSIHRFMYEQYVEHTLEVFQP